MQSSHDRSGREKGPLKGAKDGGGLQRPANGSTTAAGVRQKNSGCDEAGKPEDHRYNFSCEDLKSQISLEDHSCVLEGHELPHICVQLQETGLA